MRFVQSLPKSVCQVGGIGWCGSIDVAHDWNL
jgi:hypothetical protein